MVLGPGRGSRGLVCPPTPMRVRNRHHDDRFFATSIRGTAPVTGAWEHPCCAALPFGTCLCSGAGSLSLTGILTPARRHSAVAMRGWKRARALLFTAENAKRAVLVAPCFTDARQSRRSTPIGHEPPKKPRQHSLTPNTAPPPHPRTPHHRRPPVLSALRALRGKNNRSPVVSPATEGPPNG
jgi:hypothetical protein